MGGLLLLCKYLWLNVRLLYLRKIKWRWHIVHVFPVQRPYYLCLDQSDLTRILGECHVWKVDGANGADWLPCLCQSAPWQLHWHISLPQLSVVWMNNKYNWKVSLSVQKSTIQDKCIIIIVVIIIIFVIIIIIIIITKVIIIIIITVKIIINNNYYCY